jgi:hypothetical protein
VNWRGTTGEWCGGALIVLGCAFVGVATGCPQQAGTSTTSTSTTTTTTTPALGPVGKVNDAAGFAVGIIPNPSYTAVIHAGDDSGPTTTGASLTTPALTNPCSVTTTGSSVSDIMCYVEMEELDLWFNGVTLQHNVPSNMCEYVTIEPMWYFLYPTGIGPGLVESTTTTDGSGATTITDKDNAVSGNPFCAFNFSDQNLVTAVLGGNSGQNCCLGTYEEIQNTVNTGPTPTSSSSTTFGNEWGGASSSCVAGPGVDLLKGKDANGFPEPDIYYVAGVGLNGVYNVASPQTKKFASNVYVANYFSVDDSSTYDNPALWPAGFNPNNNNAVGTMSGAGGTTAPGAPFSSFWPSSHPLFGPYTGTFTAGPYGGAGQPFYQYICWNRDREALARIRVMIRSWDSGMYVTSNNIPNLYAGEGYNPGTVINPFGGSGANAFSDPLHDYMIWEDLSGDHGTFVLGYPNHAAYTSYTQGFPLYNQ